MVNKYFWENPPWHGGAAKHRLGLMPVARCLWLSQVPSEPVLSNKRHHLDTHYDDVVGVMPGIEAAHDLLEELPLPTPHGQDYPALIANVALTVSDDLCLLDIDDQQRLVAGCVCAPTYWRLRDKLGKPLVDVHAPVDGLNRKIGANIARFVSKAPIGQPFARTNWFLHGDASLYHPVAELQLPDKLADWIVRSERQTLCRLSSRYLLFTIEIICEPLVDIVGFAAAQSDLEVSLGRMDDDEINHFGGVAKHRRLTEYIAGTEPTP